MVKAVSGIRKGNREQNLNDDLFGFDDSGLKEAEDLAKRATAKQAEIQRVLSAVQGAAKRPDLAAVEGIDVKNPKAVQKRIEELKAEKKAWANWQNDPKLVAQLRNNKNPPKPKDDDDDQPGLDLGPDKPPKPNPKPTDKKQDNKVIKKEPTENVDKSGKGKGNGDLDFDSLLTQPEVPQQVTEWIASTPKPVLNKFKDKFPVDLNEELAQFIGQKPHDSKQPFFRQRFKNPFVSDGLRLDAEPYAMIGFF